MRIVLMPMIGVVLHQMSDVSGFRARKQKKYGSGSGCPFPFLILHEGICGLFYPLVVFISKVYGVTDIGHCTVFYCETQAL
jgi:hypothetical protein